MKSNSEVFLVLFAGTSEGRELTIWLDQNQIPAIVCVATGYGEELLEETPYIRIHTGRMDREQMKEFLLEKQPVMVVDATHPYAEMVTENIMSVCGELNLPYHRLLREASDLDQMTDVMTFDDCQSAAGWLDEQKGNILLTTGLKELPVFAEHLHDTSRIYARVLPQESVFSEAERLGLARKQLICMQGPFSREMNVATLRMTDAAFLVTKESGKAGGFQEKAEAARMAGAVCVVIRRPAQNIVGFSMEEIRDMILEQVNERSLAQDVAEIEKAGREAVADRKVWLLGIGMGSLSGMTKEAMEICEQADCIIGASRMLNTLKAFQKPMVSMYRSEDIAAYISDHPEYQNIVIGLSGDVGFYSGAKKLTGTLSGMQVTRICGISSVMYFAAKLNMSWEDMKLTSSHGRQQNIIAAVRENEKVFTLVSNAESVRELSLNLTKAGFADIAMYVGVDLSYPTEQILDGSAQDFLDFEEPGICAVILENPMASETPVVPGIPDEEFIRGKVPMTKEEIRSLSVCKLQLTRRSVMYDVGAGTGSVSVESARIAADGVVYAIEKKEEALDLICRNKARFAVPNLEVIEGTAPEALKPLPAPSHVFIGGSSGNLEQILRVVLTKNPHVHIVLNCITLETLSEALQAAKILPLRIEDICSVTAAKSRELGNYHLMMGQNPVYIITMKGLVKDA